MTLRPIRFRRLGVASEGNVCHSKNANGATIGTKRREILFASDPEGIRAMPSRRDLLLALAALASSLTASRLASGEAASVFYVDPLGDDNNDGRSPTTAWRTAGKISGVTLSAGCIVLFSRGNVWRERLRIRFDNITIGSYGNGALPVITGADRISKMSAEPALVARSRDGPNSGLRLWSGDLPNEPTQVFMNDIRGERVLYAADVNDDRQWHWALNKLTVCAGGSDLPTIEASTRDYAADFNDCVGLTIQDIHFARGAFDNVRADTLAESTVQRVTITDAFVTGLSASSDQHRDRVTIQDCVLSGCGGSGIIFGGRIDGWLIQRNVIKECCQLTDSVLGTLAVSAANFRWTCGIKNWGWGQAGWQGSYSIRKNTVLDCHPVAWALNPNGGHGVGIWADEVVQPAGRPSIVYNTVARCYSRGCYLEKVDHHDLDYNLIYRCATAKISGGLGIQANQYGFDVATNQPDNNAPRGCTSNRIRHNTVVGGWWQLEAVCNDQKCSLSDNLIEDNIFCPLDGKGSSVYIHGGGANDKIHGHGNVYQNNNWGIDGVDSSRVWGSVKCTTLGMFEEAARGAIIDSIPGDPLFINPALDEYRIKPNSPCRDAASNAPLTFDIVGQTVPAGSAADLGCYEVQ
jgi:hypothetical protein